MSLSNPTTPSKRLFLFGGTSPWTSTEWTAQDDRVRGGSSVSYLIPSSTGTTAIFNGNLDTKTLGGAGFASQRTTEGKTWDLSEYDGIELTVSRSGMSEKTNKTFTFVLKDSVPGVYNDQKTGLLREESTLSYEAKFKPGHAGEKVVFLGWGEFRAFYRGREKKDAKALDMAGIRRFSVMARSFFDEQSGPFQVTLVSVAAVKGQGKGKEPEGFYDEYDEFDRELDDYESLKEERNGGRGWWECAVL